MFNAKIDEFIGINRSRTGNALGYSYALEAVNVDTKYGNLSRCKGAQRQASIVMDSVDGETVRDRIVLETLSGIYDGILHLGLKKYKHAYYISDNNDDLMSDTGRTYDMCVDEGVTGTSIMDSCDHRDMFVVTTSPAGQLVKMANHNIKPFGTGSFLAESPIASVEETDGTVTALVFSQANAPDESAQERALTDGVFIFAGEAGEEYLWLKVTGFTVNEDLSVRMAVDVNGSTTVPSVGDTAKIRGGCSNQKCKCVIMHYGRLFASSYPVPQEGIPYGRRLYWSCLEGDGRTIEDWTRTEASIDTSGGHVDIGNPNDGAITALVSMQNQIIIFMEQAIYRLYGAYPSAYVVERCCELRLPVESCEVAMFNGVPYWLSRNGICYFNGNNADIINDNNNVAAILEWTGWKHGTGMAASCKQYIYFYYSTDDPKYYILKFDTTNGAALLFELPQQTKTLISFENNVYIDSCVGTMSEDAFGTERISQDLCVLDHSDSWNGEEIHSYWKSHVLDFGSINAKKKGITFSMRGTGEFNLYVENETNKSHSKVVMPTSLLRAKDIVPQVAEGRVMQFVISDEEGRDFCIDGGLMLQVESGVRV